MCRKTLIACILCTIILGSSSAETIIPAGDVSGIWEAAGSPYLIEGDITIPAGDNLTIDPGVTVEFRGHYNLTVLGWLYAEGTEEDTIFFTANDELDGWKGIRFINAPDSSYLSYCSIRHGRADGSGSEGRGGAIYCGNSNPVISHCSIRDNSAQNTGGAISSDGSSPTIYRCVITGNSANNSGGGIYTVESNVTVIHCTISGNSAPWGGGMYCSSDLSSTIINTIVANNSGNGGINIDAAENISITYCDFYNNGANFFGALPLGLENLVTVNTNGDSCDVFYNIYMDPMFVDFTGGDFKLLAGSPCIDAGDPLAPKDPDATNADMGALIFDQSLWVEKGTESNHPASYALLYNYPNPFNPSTTISFVLSEPDHVKLSVYGVSGQLIAELINSYKQAGNHEIGFDGTGLPSGVYVYRLEAGHNSASGKMVLMK